jgi:dihydroorotate dehydrogenase (fumarate)
MDLSTTYLGLKLKNPLVASASPLSKNVDSCRRLEDAGISAIVSYSLFEEQITHQVYELDHYMTKGTESFSESLSYFPEPAEIKVGPEEYTKYIASVKKAVKIPFIASLNGYSEGGWVSYAKKIQEAGADALELNVYFLPTDPNLSSLDVENTYLNILRSVKAQVTIPVAVKIGPYFSSMTSMANRLSETGVDGLVLFNRFYQPDIDLENLSVVPNVLLSTPQAMRMPLRWIAILYGRIKVDLAATGGIHSADDVLKMLMAGANVTMLCSVLLKKGPEHVAVILENLRQWMQDHEYDSVAQMRGSMSQQSCANPAAFERANYMKALREYK